ncbi:restriction endonuclease subunit S [Mycobacterium sp. E3339]|uniref:restriction endonuclease subunit S n=1 Tax=Mycobacterium sp. E3339 TaxID=1834146 RepID=UPI0007FC0A17|nr:restriction endonuclease subunit S [Mycobacterium sp. E3339]OBG69762.1 hypothetical protein A5702_11740 [Mycobacterium sp. E3339]
MNWPAYPIYKDSGLAHLGPVPSDWSVERMSWLFGEISSGTTPDSKDGKFYGGDINWVTTGELRERAIAETTQQVSASALASYSALKIYPPGTLLIAMYGATIGRLGWLEQPACTNQACCAFANPLRVETRFAYYSLSAARDHLIFLASGGGQPNINQDKLRSLRIAVPSRGEQAAIVKFLDRETAKIDALIAKQEQLIATLRENRTATITHAVTKGLEPDVQMTDSGIEWIGAFPNHWSHSFIKYACAILTGFPFKSEGFTEDVDDIRLLRGTNVGVNQIDWTDVVRWPRDDASVFTDYALHQGDIVMGLDRPFISTGIRVARIRAGDIPSLLLQRVARIRALPGFERDYLFHLLTGPGIVHHLTPIFTGVSVPHLSPDQLASFPIPQPPIDEQRRIVEYLADRCAHVDALIKKADVSTDTLREYRSALITDAVTGKIDVRRAA